MPLREMNPPLHKYPPLEQDSTTLAYAAQLLCRGKGSRVVDDIFTAVLTRTLSRGDPDESAILQAAAHTLSDRQDDDALHWLMHEIEMECELQHLPEPASGKHKACVLFSIPVVAPADKELPASLFVNHAFESMHAILEEAQLFDEQAVFKLVPRLLTPEDLRGRSKTSLRSLTRSLGTQLLADRNTVLELPADFYAETPPRIDDLSQYEYAQLRYLVGVVAVDDEFLDTVFPELSQPVGDVADEGEASDTPGAEAGWLSNGSWWSHPFCEKLAECLSWMEAELSCCPPAGFHDDARLGLTLLREQDARLQFGIAIAASSLTGVEMVVEEWPLSTPSGQVVGVAVYLVDAQEPERVYAAVSWSMFHHETLDDAIDELHGMLTDLELAAADETLSCDSGSVSYLLH